MKRFNRLVKLNEIVQHLPYSADGSVVPDPPACETCHNSGWVHDGRGNALPCPEGCEASQEYVAKRIARGFARSGLPERYREFTFESWRELGVDARRGKLFAFYAAQAFAEHPAQRISLHAVIAALAAVTKQLPAWMLAAGEREDVVRRGFVLSGSVGTGKTGLCVAVMNSLLSRGTGVMYMRVLDVLKALSQTWQSGGEKELLEKFKAAPVLFLDDFGMDVAPADYQRAYMQIILRWRHGNNLPTMITTNLTREQFSGDWGVQTSDVVFELCHWIPLGGAKLRDTQQIIEEF